MLFSERRGYKPIKALIQKDGIDDDLRNGLWDAVNLCILDHNDHLGYNKNFQNSLLFSLFLLYWHQLFKLTTDSIQQYFENAIIELRNKYFQFNWYEVYDFIEFTANNCPDHLSDEFTNFCNRVLEREKSAYRFVEKILTDITSEEELESIELAVKDTSKYAGVNSHLKSALKFLVDRENPSYRNSIKESISSVESLVKVISNDSKATLGSALNIIEKSHKIHPAFKKALSNLYGYTNDSGGIRHALLEEDTITYIDAKFMLVSCTAFINYILGKISEGG